MPEPEDGSHELALSCSSKLQEEDGSLKAATEVQSSELATPLVRSAGELEGKDDTVQEDVKQDEERESGERVGDQASEASSVGNGLRGNESVSKVTEGSCTRASDRPVQSDSNDSGKDGPGSASSASLSTESPAVTVSPKKGSSRANTGATRWKGSDDGPR